jgi:MGT family glycosyltransferase
MKIGFICLNLPGHLNPMTAVARQLQTRGHEVVFLYLPSANGLPCTQAEKNDAVNATRPAVSKLAGWEALKFYCGIIAKQTEEILESLPRMVEKAGIDALVLDPMQFFSELGALKLGLPYVSVAVAFYLDYSGYTPFGVGLTDGDRRRLIRTSRLLDAYGLPHETTPEAFARNRKGVAEFARVIYTERTKAYAKEAGIKLDWDAPTALFSKLAHITQVPKEFDFENPLLPPQFYHTGPFYDANARPKIDFPWERLTGEPLIYASMGTILNGQVDVFRAIAAGVAKHKDTQLVLSIGDQLDPKDIGTVPDNAIIVKKAPQVDVLKRASVCITHCGLNTVLESLACGVPQVAFPVTFDQPNIAIRIAAKKTGVTAEFEKLTPDHLSTLLDEVLNNAVYRENARKLQDAIAKTNGLRKAADIIERAFGVSTGAPSDPDLIRRREKSESSFQR